MMAGIKRFSHHHNVYLLMGGLALGMLVSPWGWGRFSPDQQAQWLPNPQAIQQQLATLDQTRKHLADAGVTSVALVEYDRQRQGELHQLKQQLEKTRHLRGYMDSLMLAVIVLMAVESLFGSLAPQQAVIRTVRFAMMGLWLAGLLGQPFLFADISLAVIGLGVGAGLLSSILKRPMSESEDS